MDQKKIVICGLGTVGREFLKLARERKNLVKQKYGLEMQVIGIAELGGSLYDEGKELPLEEIISTLAQGGKIQTLGSIWKKDLSGRELLETAKADILVETTPTNLQDGEPGTTHIRTAIKEGMDVVSANKGPLVLYYSELQKEAKKHGSRLFISAATAAALPTLDVGILSTAGAKVLNFEGILNGTTNFILTKMTKEGVDYESALKEAQQLSIAETNPKLDVEGYDTANKCVLIANRLFDLNLDINKVEREGITGVTQEDIKAAKDEGKVIKLIGKAFEENGEYKLTIKPEKIDATHPLASINLSEKGVSFTTDILGQITISGGKSSPVGAAGALLKDIIHSDLLK